MERSKNRFVAVALACAVSGLLAGTATANMNHVTGSLSTASGVTANGGWSSFQIAWDIQYTGSNWFYQYTLSTVPTIENPALKLTPAVSHLILELSDNFTAANWWDHSGGIARAGDIDTHSTGAGNPGWPTGKSFFGGKIDEMIDTGGVQVVSFYSDRAPQWSDFYAKGGGGPTTSYAYNSSFGVAVDNPNTYWLPAMAGQTALHKILAPDTVTVPIPAPAAASLGVVGLSLVSLVRRRMA